MAVNFTYEIGYMGVVKFADPASSVSAGTIPAGAVSILATSGNISVQQSPIFSTGVWGAGWYTAAQQIAYAPNYVTTSGSIGYQLTCGDAFNKIQNFAFEKRNEGMIICILPNGKAGYYGKGWCQSCSFTASQDAIVTGDIGFKTGNVENCIATSDAYSNTNEKSGSGSLNSAFGTNYMNVFPFWASGVYLDDASGYERPSSLSATSSGFKNDIIDWSANYSSQVVLVATCANYTSMQDSKQAKYCTLGTMSADGSFTIFKIASQLDPDSIRKCRKCTISMGPASKPAEKAKIIYGSIIFSNGSPDIQTGSSFIQSSFNFTALGTGYGPIMSLSKDGCSW